MMVGCTRRTIAKITCVRGRRTRADDAACTFLHAHAAGTHAGHCASKRCGWYAISLHEGECEGEAWPSRVRILNTGVDDEHHAQRFGTDAGTWRHRGVDCVCQ